MIKLKFNHLILLTVMSFFLSILLVPVIANSLASQEIINLNRNFVPLESTTLVRDLPSTDAQAQQSPNSVTSETPDVNLRVTPDNKILLSSQDILILLTIVLIGALVLLFTLLSPITGLLGYKASPENLKAKSEFLTAAFPSLLQGVTVILIVMIVTVLTLAGWIESQGTISILSALIGYVLGRKATELEYSKPYSIPPSIAKAKQFTLVPVKAIS